MMHEAIGMAEMALIKRVISHMFGDKSLKSWVDKSWKPFLGYSPISLVLAQGSQLFSLD
jgi:hypothetical protein